MNVNVPDNNVIIDVETIKKETSVHPDVKLTWSDLSYSVPLKGKQVKHILNGIHGHVNPGEVIAIMGSSGSGKTTLLNALAGRIGPGELTGSVLVDGRPRDYSTWRHTVAYVEQEDLMYQNLTVRETLTYAALLRLPKTVSRADKLKKVENIIQSLGLATCQDTIIGDSEKRGISGGERKRVSIGVEMVTDPRLLFLDEPTSGLDAFTAAYIIETVKNVAKKDKTAVLLTIHQPREYILTMFDRIILLSGGKLVFSGAVKGKG